MYNIMLQASKLARKCEIKHSYACGADDRSYACGADGRVVGVRSRDCQMF